MRISTPLGVFIVCLGFLNRHEERQSHRPEEQGSEDYACSLGKGADLGGLEGADQHCQTLARATGAGQHTWRAYLSTQATALNDPNFVNARDRIGSGPWQNAKGVVIARNVEELH